MSEKVVQCGICRATSRIPDGDWNIEQQAAIDRWLSEHANTSHPGEEVIHSVEPNPLSERLRHRQ